MKLILRLDTSVVPVNRPVPFLLMVRNTSGKAQNVERRWMHQAHVTLVVRDRRGRPVPFPGSNIGAFPPPPRGPQDFVRLDAGYYYGVDSATLRCEVKLREPGVYRLTARLSLADHRDEVGLQTWYGTIVSEDVEVTVRK